jgi:thioredoxin-dependent peroxiredoxin
MAAKKRVVAKAVKRGSAPAAAPKAKRQAKVAKASPSALPTKKLPTKKKASAVAKKVSTPARVAKGAAGKTSGKVAGAATSAAEASAVGASAAAGKLRGKALGKVEATAPGGLAAGARAPAFDLIDQSGESVSSSALAGQPYVLYFYPKNDTPGCTTEACGFRDAYPDFERLGVRVIGVSPDSVVSHQKFIAKYGLPFTLLSDGAQALASKYGVWSLKKNYGREYMGIVRSTFLVDGEGTIRKAWRGIRVNGHIAEVQAAAAALPRASA